MKMSASGRMFEAFGAPSLEENLAHIESDKAATSVMAISPVATESEARIVTCW